MNPRQLAWTLAAGVHLALVICGAAGLRFTGESLPSTLLATYGAISGAENGYGFFAPAVASQSRAVLTMKDKTGREWQDALIRDEDSVAGFRAATVFDAFPALPEQVRRGLAASWAGVMFGRHPGAEEVLVKVEIELLPTMEEWRRGRRAAWSPIYQGTFLRKHARNG